MLIFVCAVENDCYIIFVFCYCSQFTKQYASDKRPRLLCNTSIHTYIYSRTKYFLIQTFWTIIPPPPMYFVWVLTDDNTSGTAVVKLQIFNILFGSRQHVCQCNNVQRVCYLYFFLLPICPIRTRARYYLLLTVKNWT